MNLSRQYCFGTPAVTKHEPVHHIIDIMIQTSDLLEHYHDGLIKYPRYIKCETLGSLFPHLDSLDFDQDSLDFDQTGRTPRLVRDFAWCTVILFSFCHALKHIKT